MLLSVNYLDSLAQLRKNEEIYIYGAGSFSQIFHSQLLHYREDVKILKFIDRTKRGELNNIEIVRPDDIPYNNKYKIIVCTSIDYWEDIHLGLGNENMLFNRFHDFNVFYRRTCRQKDSKGLRQIFKNSREVNTMLTCIQDKNIQPLVESKGLVGNYDKFLDRKKIKTV